ncbi:dihydrofolate reductase [Pelagibacterium luteolum]|uniref:dihydrofolate reductase n=1 Tax=Pelagibacterium luteolum TaxID=440168 RepID=A0A1G7UI30_9HYPH|nr:dihydrofolate reductase [Pelagibacterium luteolum]SDG47163.1 dihydrofolate reductase [Pelagibacterium luteolum]
MATKPIVRVPSATYIVARSYPDNIIGVDNELPWHLRTDLQHFKKRTSGHVILMGRKTFESLGRPLPNRTNIVLSRSKIADTENLIWAQDPETALLLAEAYTICRGNREFFIIGGENIYKLFFKYVDEAWVTDVFCGNINGDAKFEFDFPSGEWRTRSEEEFAASAHDDWKFRISHFVRRKKQHRQRMRDEFLKVDVDVMRHLDEWQERFGIKLDDSDSTESSSHGELNLQRS